LVDRQGGGAIALRRKGLRRHPGGGGIRAHGRGRRRRGRIDRLVQEKRVSSRVAFVLGLAGRMVL
jgi:hypothetical protein